MFFIFRQTNQNSFSNLSAARQKQTTAETLSFCGGFMVRVTGVEPAAS